MNKGIVKTMYIDGKKVYIALDALTDKEFGAYDKPLDAYLRLETEGYRDIVICMNDNYKGRAI